MIKRIKALNKKEFKNAFSNSEVYGQYLELMVYIELGEQGEYKEHPKDDSKTEYKIFFDCYIEYALTLQELEDENPKATEEKVTVILYW